MRASTIRILLVVLLAFLFSVGFTIAVLAGAPVLVAVVIGLVLVVALSLVSIAGSLTMTTITQEVRLALAAPRELVYEVLSDPRRLVKWDPNLVSVDVVSGEPGATGFTWRVRMANGVVLESEVIEAEPPARQVVRSGNVPRRLQRSTSWITERTLEATPAGTELRATRRVRAPLIVRPILLLRRGGDQRLAAWMDERLRDEIEARARTLT